LVTSGSRKGHPRSPRRGYRLLFKFFGVGPLTLRWDVVAEVGLVMGGQPMGGFPLIWGTKPGQDQSVAK
jgi:hypothetical protein